MTHNKIHIYQLLPRLFSNCNTTNKKNGTIESNGCGKLEEISTTALKEIKELGFSHIWYTGIIEHASKTSFDDINVAADHPDVVKGNAGSPYAIKDYYDVAPALATNTQDRMREFERLIERTHNNKLKAIIDFVPNHTARSYSSDAKPANTRDLGQDDMSQISFHCSNNFYYLPEEQLDLSNINNTSDYTETPAKVTGNDCFSNKPSNNDWYETVKLNYGKDFLTGKSAFNPIPSTWTKMYDILIFWANKGVDGFRCDMAEMVPVEFWHWVIEQIKDKFPNIIFIGEVYNPAQYKSFIDYGKFDYLYDKVGLYDTIKNIIQGHQSASDITRCWQETNPFKEKMLYFLENHDEQRIASNYFAGDPWKAISSLLLISTMGSNPTLIYFGQELGETGMEEAGFSGSDGRTTIFDYWGLPLYSKWVNNKKYDGQALPDNLKALRATYKNILNYALSEPTITDGAFYDLQWCNQANSKYNSSKIYSYVRHSNDKKLLFILNFADTTEDIELYINEEAINTIGINPKGLTIKEVIIRPDEVIPFYSSTHNSISTSIAPWGFKIFELL